MVSMYVGRLAIEEAPVIPLLFTRAYWGLRRDLTISPRADSNTLAATVRTAK